MAAAASNSLWKSIDGYKLSTGDKYSVDDQLAFHNLGFQEYHVDWTLSVQSFELIFGAQWGHVSHLSLYVHTGEDDFVGLARSSIRGQRAWVVGLALVPTFRGKGIGPVLLREYLNLLRERSDVHLVQLEVIKKNTAALKLYKRFGFETNFQLRDFKIKDVKALPEPNPPVLLTVSVSDRLDTSLPWLQHRTTYSWQRELSALLNSSRGMRLYSMTRGDGQLVVVLAVETTRSPMRICGFAYHKDSLTAVDLASAIRAAGGHLSTQFDIYLEPEFSEVILLFEAIEGCERDEELEEAHMILAI